jgi:glyoxylase-like metal-dependent hydrolase (beta-lactamase superfamily II)
MMQQLEEDLFVLELGGTGYFGLHPTLMLTEQGPILADAGYPQTHDELLKQLAACGVKAGDLHSLLITHHDFDHIGGVKALLAENPNLRIFAHEVETPYCDGTKSALKASSDAERERLKAFSFPVDVELVDNQILPAFGGIRVIHTLGHTFGHCAYYLPERETLITGDALVAIDGVLQGPRPEYAYDLELAHQALNSFLDLPLSTCICYHGGVVSGNMHDELQRVIAAGPGAMPSPERPVR